MQLDIYFQKSNFNKQNYNNKICFKFNKNKNISIIQLIDLNFPKGQLN